MKESYRLLLAFLFILPASLGAKTDPDFRRTTIVEDVERLNQRPQSEEKFRSGLELGASTVPKEDYTNDSHGLNQNSAKQESPY